MLPDSLFYLPNQRGKCEDQRHRTDAEQRAETNVLDSCLIVTAVHAREYRRIGSDGRRSGDHDRHSYGMILLRHDPKAEQSEHRNEDQSDNRRKIGHLICEELLKLQLCKIAAEYDHGKRAVHRCYRPDHSHDRCRQLDRQEEEKKSENKSDEHRICQDLFRLDAALVLRHDKNAVGPLKEVQYRDVGGDVEHGGVAESHLNERDAHKARVREGNAELPHRVLLTEDQRADKHRQKQREKRRKEGYRKPDRKICRIILDIGFHDRHRHDEIQKDLSELPASGLRQDLTLIQQKSDHHVNKHDNILL